MNFLMDPPQYRPIIRDAACSVPGISIIPFNAQYAFGLICYFTYASPDPADSSRYSCMTFDLGSHVSVDQSYYLIDLRI